MNVRMFRLLPLLLFASLACSSRPVVVTRSRLLMGHVPVTIEVKTPLRQKNLAYAAEEAAFDRAVFLEKQISEYQEHSEISCLNREAGKNFCPVSEGILDLLRLALEWNSLTRGAFDIRFASRSFAGRRGEILLDPVRSRARLVHPETRIGMASLGKGWIVDAMIAELQRLGFDQALVHAGGDLRAIGGPWKVAIHRPFAAADSTTPVREIHDAAWASAGDEEQGGHIRDPRTGKPVLRRAGVTLWGKSLTRVNALATAAFVLGEKEACEVFSGFSEVEGMVWVDEEGARFCP